MRASFHLRRCFPRVVVDRFLRRSGSRVSILMACRREVPLATVRGYGITRRLSLRKPRTSFVGHVRFYFVNFVGRASNSHRPLRSLRGFDLIKNLTTLRMPSDGTRMVSSEVPETITMLALMVAFQVSVHSAFHLALTPR